MTEEYEMEYTREDELLERITELETENAELKEVHESDKRSLRLIAKKGADLEREISVLLSCKNCSENKGGYICQKEYEDKCLSQKIQYIKELQEENAELKKDKAELCHSINEAGKAYTKLKEENNYLSEQIQKLKIELDTPESVVLDKLDEAKEIIKRLIDIINHDLKCFDTMAGLDIKQKAEQFLKECE